MTTIEQPSGSSNGSGPPGEVSSRADASLEIFSACPVSVGVSGVRYRATIWDVARWSERHGCTGILVYADNRLVDPWIVAQAIIQSTRRLSPLVATQPAYMHPYSVAKMVATLSSLYGRKLFINWVAGGFKNDLEALADRTPHDDRYERLIEYATVVRRLTDGDTVTFDGKYYETRGLKLQPPVDPRLRPEFVVSGSSPAGAEAASVLGARAVTYAGPPTEDADAHEAPAGSGLRMGIIAREDRDDAWRTAYTRFPPDKRGSLMRRLARRVSDSQWHERLCQMADERAGDGTPYWMVPFENYKTMCPYLVGTHDEVAAVVSRYIAGGYSTFILDEPAEEADLTNARIVFERAKSFALEVVS